MYTECDIALEAVPGAPDEEAVRAAILEVRDGLLAEHLGVGVEEVAAAQREAGSLVQAVERLRTETGRTLRALDPPPLNAAERELGKKHLLDPERPVPASQLIGKLLSSGAAAVRKTVLERFATKDG